VAAQKKAPLAASERDEEERARWRELVGRFDARRFLFVDECGAHTSMTRTRARAPKGKRAHGRVPRNRGKNTTLIASLSLGGMGQAMTFQGSTDKMVFEAYVERFLAPALHPGQVVILDNLGAHKGQRVRDLVETRRLPKGPARSARPHNAARSLAWAHCLRKQLQSMMA
jgi:DDE superfamily endonuclease